MLKLLFAMLACAVGAVSSAAQEIEAWAALEEVSALECSFPKGTVAKWDAASPMLTPDSGLKGVLRFTSIDRETGTAILLGSGGSTQVSVIATPGEITFVETTALGSIIVTTVFGNRPSGSPGEFIAVHSRHVVGMAEFVPPISSQYHGTCKPSS